MTIGLTFTGILIANIGVMMVLNLTFLLFEIYASPGGSLRVLISEGCLREEKQLRRLDKNEEECDF